MYKTLSRAHTTKNIETAIACFAYDAKILNPDGCIAVGRDEIYKSIQEWWSSISIESAEFQVLECEKIREDILFDIASYTLHFRKAGKRYMEKGRHFVLWRLDESGEWKIWRDLAQITTMRRYNA